MRKRISAALIPVCLVAITLACAETASAQANLVVYDDALQNSFADYGWAADRNFGDTTQHHGGTKSLSFSSDASWEGVNVNGSIDTSSYDALLIWVRGSQAGQVYSITLAGVSGNLGTAS